MSTKKKHRYLRNLDWSILLILLGLAFFSYMGISGASPRYGEDTKQLIWYGIGFSALFITLFFDYKILNTFSYVFYGFGLLSLIALLLFGEESNNVVRDFSIGKISFSPAEFMKIFFIMAVARWFAKIQEKGIRLHAFYQLWPVFLMFVIPFLLIVKQPDLGTALALTGIFMCIMIAAGVRFRHFLYLGMIGTTGISALVYLYIYKEEVFFKIIKPYQWKRITSFIDPDADPVQTGYHLKQSLIAVGSGTLQGKGINDQTLAKNSWLPAGETDFVFSVIAERFGFIGASILILLFFMLIYRMIRIAMNTDDRFGSYFVSGVVGMFMFQIFENIGMTIGIMPITGIPLPFISYGGSSLAANMVAVGLVINIGMRRNNTLSF